MNRMAASRYIRRSFSQVRVDFTNLIFVTIVLGLFCVFVVYAAFIIKVWENQAWFDALLVHLRATAGMPTAAFGAFVVATLFRTTEGQIKFQAPGFKFAGASGPIIMWVLCFLAITSGIRLLY
jgi:hypothetical protein